MAIANPSDRNADYYAVIKIIAFSAKSLIRRKKEEGRRKARHGFGHGYTDGLFSVYHS
ncbi:MAG: hypothetical protein ACRC62_02810 [Microcoleus sp.]